MLDEMIVTEVPPLYCCYGHIGAQVRVPITGGHARRILHGAINVGSGDVVLLNEVFALRLVSKKYGKRFGPCAELRRRAENGETFYGTALERMQQTAGFAAAASPG